MTLDELVALMKVKPYLKGMGKGLLSERYHINPEDVIEAKKRARTTTHIPKVLLFDIETAPIKAYVWKLWKTNIYTEQVLNDWFCIAWSAKWLYSNKVMGDVLTPNEALEEDDKRLMVSLWKLINEADIVIAHNGRRFDIPRINARFILNGLPPTTPYYIIDTYQIAKKQFGFTSNKLDALATYFNIPHKLDTDFELWKKCLEGDKKALSYMLKYNKRDVVMLEEIYLKLRPWIKNHPNMGNLSGDTMCCCRCGSTNIEEIEGKYFYTTVGTYPLYKCDDCNGISRGRKTIKRYPEVVSNSR